MWATGCIALDLGLSVLTRKRPCGLVVKTFACGDKLPGQPNILAGFFTC